MHFYSNCPLMRKKLKQITALLQVIVVDLLWPQQGWVHTS